MRGLAAIENAGADQIADQGSRQPRAAAEIAQVGEGLIAAGGQDARAPRFAQAVQVAQTETERGGWGSGE